jgi:predicted DNA-binding transcriptional regulator YafY
MGKLADLIKIVNLLSHRRHVTLSSITKTCNIAERTAYRYLNSISEANIPVYYDKERRCYSLTNYDGSALSDISTNDIVLCLVALVNLRREVGDTYGEAIDEMATKLVIRSDGRLEKAWDFIREAVTTNKDVTVQEILSLAFAATAIALECPVDIRTGGDVRCRLNQPGLEFAGEWWVSDVASDQPQRTRLRDVEAVDILDGPRYGVRF